MKKWRVSGIYGCSVEIGVFEAETKEEAIGMAEQSDDFDGQITLCHQCSDVTQSDLNYFESTAEEVE